MADNFRLRLMEPRDWDEVAELIYLSLNVWTEKHRGFKLIAGSWETMRIFPRVYEALDPNCCILVVDDANAKKGRIVGSCFFHPRPTHVALGILNTHPDYFGKGIGSKLLRHVIEFTEKRGQPLRLVSQTTNLESFSLYSRAGFVPTCFFQDLTLTVPEAGFSVEAPAGTELRAAVVADIPAMVELEKRIMGIDREHDYRFFLKNDDGIWHSSILYGTDGDLRGFIVSVKDPGSNMLGPGVARTEEDAIALVRYELNSHRGLSPVWLVPARARILLEALYAMGAKNCDLHVSQLRDPNYSVRNLDFDQPQGIVFPTFMPESG